MRAVLLLQIAVGCCGCLNRAAPPALPSLLQGEQMRQRFELAMAAKEGQLDSFRRELDGLLAAARLMQEGQQGLPLPAGGPGALQLYGGGLLN